MDILLVWPQGWHGDSLRGRVNVMFQRLCRYTLEFMKLKWIPRKVGGWITDDGKWSVRGPIMSKPMFWLYKSDGRPTGAATRYTPTGRYDDCVSFKTASEAKKYAESFELCNISSGQ